jgi:phosphopantetheinyl transferase
LPLEPQEDHQLIKVSDNFKIAHQTVDYDHYEELKQEIAASIFSFNDYFYRMSNRNRQIEWLSIRSLLLSIGLRSDIVYDEHGKPHLKNNHEHLSISHSQHRIAVSIHQKKAHGIDLQHISPKIIRIKQKFLNQAELDMLEKSDDSITLTVLWSMKEALFKSYGKKDIFLKGNIELSELNGNERTFEANGRIHGIGNEIRHRMKAELIDDYILAYTLIP